MTQETHDLIKLWNEIQKEEVIQKKSHIRKKKILSMIGAIYDKKVLGDRD